MAPSRPFDLPRLLLQILALGALIGTSLWIMRPFLVALAWATMIVVATWPLLEGVQRGLGGRRGLAVAVMTIALLLILVVPFYLTVGTLVENGKALVEWSQSHATWTIPPPPGWLESVPVVGARLADQWREIEAAGATDLAERLAPFAQTIALWLLARVGSAGQLLLQLFLTVVIAAILYTRGEEATRAVDRFARRLAGDSGQHAVRLASQAVRAVALGVVVTAIAQSALSGLGMALAGVPFAAVLTALIFVLAIAQVGAAPVLLVAVIWVYARSGAASGTVFLVWALFCSVFDNVARPILIRRGANLPLLLIFVGVLGGLIAFGVIGLFIGPVVLAVAHTLLVEWISQGEEASVESR